MNVMGTLNNCKEVVEVEVLSFIGTAYGLIASGGLGEIRNQMKEDIRELQRERQAEKDLKAELQAEIEKLTMEFMKRHEA